MFGLGKAAERTRQWRLLGLLLKQTRLLDALDFMAEAFGDATVHWRGLREKAAYGVTLSALVDDYEPKTPPEVVEALREGEKDGRLPERLEALPVPEAAGRVGGGEEPAVVGLVDAVLADAVRKGVPRIALALNGDGTGAIGHPSGEHYLPVEGPTNEGVLSAMRRRLWVMAGQPYWAPKPASFRVRTPEGDVEARLRMEPPDTLIVELSRTPASR
jgi:hypothetical protein